MRRLPLPSLLTLVTLGGFVAVACVPSPEPVQKGSAPSACSVTRVVDGDTVDMTCPGEGRFRARLTGFDTPESHEPRCAAEAELARAATLRLRGMVRGAGRVDAQLGGWDRYDRRLVRLALDGRDVGATLIAEGLALPYSGGRRPDWCARLG
ncbi:thermonuclease family protein [Roseicyclus sp.]